MQNPTSDKRLVAVESRKPQVRTTAANWCYLDEDVVDQIFPTPNAPNSDEQSTTLTSESGLIGSTRCEDVSTELKTYHLCMLADF